MGDVLSTHGSQDPAAAPQPTGDASGSSEPPAQPSVTHQADGVVAATFVVFEYAIVASLLLVSAVVIVRTILDFVRSTGTFPKSIVPAVDGILVVIILMDIVQTVFKHLRRAAFSVRPFLVIGILAGVRDILSASAHLTLDTNLTSHDFNQTLAALGVGVGLVLALLFGLFILGHTGHPEDDE